MNAPLKADVTAAERLLKAAVRRAVEDLRSVVFNDRSSSLTIGYKSPMIHAEVVATLTTAGHAAELLLSERAS